MTALDWEGGEHLIFIGGSPRSGTTLVQNILDSHPDIAGGPEFNLIRYFMKLHHDVDSFIGLNTGDSKNTLTICSFKDFEQELGTMIENLLLGYGTRKKKKFVSEKTPDNILFFPTLLHLFPKARFIFCVRDPRSIVSSLFEVGKRARIKGIDAPVFTRNIFSAINMVNQYNFEGFKVIGDKRVMIVTYEKLTQYPEVETRQLCEWLCLEWHPDLLKQDEITHDAEIGLEGADSGVWYSKEQYFQKISPKNIDSWKIKLHPFYKGILYFNYRNNLQLQSLGYSFSKDNIPSFYLFLSSVTLGLKRIMENTVSFILSNILRVARKSSLLKNLYVRISKEFTH